MSTLITVYEKAIAGYLESKIKGTSIKLWADAFSSNASVRRTSQIFFGLQNVNYETGSFDPSIGRKNKRKILTFELQALVQTLHNHQATLDLMDEAFAILDGYQPFIQVEPIELVGYGTPRRNNSEGSWLYTGTVRGEIWAATTTLTPRDEAILEPQIIGVGLYHMAATATPDRTWGTP